MTYRDDTIEGRLLAGDLAAIGTVVRWIAVVLTSQRFWSLRSEWVDLHQEVMTRVIASLRHGRFDPSQDLRVYVQAVARYTAMEAQHHQPGPPSAGLHDSQPPPVNGSDLPDEQAASRQMVRLALEKASEPCRALVRAYYLEQRSYAEIAATMGIPVGTVKSRLVRCLQSIHQAMTEGSRPAEGERGAPEPRRRPTRPDEIS